MDVHVQKYGGTSLADDKRLREVATRVIERKEQGKSMLVVVSAMNHTTEDLIARARRIHSHPSPRELDMLLSTGEQMSVSLLAMAVESLGYEVISLTGGMSGIHTDNRHKQARIIRIDAARILRELEQGRIVLVAGFQGITPDGDITTLGRGGSDTTAVALAAAVGAAWCEVYTDVDGVYTGDPNIIPEAQLLRAVTYDEMLELSRLGAGVLSTRSVELAKEHGVKLHVRSAFSAQPGTKVMEVEAMEEVLVRGVTMDANIARISVAGVPDRPGIAFGLFKQLASEGVSVDMIIQNLNRAQVNDISFTVSKDDAGSAVQACWTFLESIGGHGMVLQKDDVAKVSIVGTGITNSTGVASTLFGTLYEAGINIEMISTSEIKISVIIDAGQADEALRKLHGAFSLDSVELS